MHESKINHSISLQVRFNDVDIAGHVNNAVYQEYFDYGKLKYFNLVLGDQVDWKKEGIVLANINIDFFLPIWLEEEIKILTKVVSFGTKSFKIHQEIWDLEDKELKSRAISTMVSFDFVDHAPIAVPVFWKEKITAFESVVKL
jgi:acyl-CoA thioester hydrolase